MDRPDETGTWDTVETGDFTIFTGRNMVDVDGIYGVMLS